MQAFETYHPMTIFIFFMSVISMSMFFMHPVFLILTIFAAMALNIMLRRQQFWKDWKMYVPLFIIMSIINPLISHNGERVLFYVNGNAITLEAIFYGIAIATMIVAVMLWFSCYNEVMTSDKFIYLFGKISPVLSLTITIALRLVPRFTHQLGLIARAQKTIGMDYTSGSLWHRIKCTVRIISILITWALENAIDTADSMKARGYGVRKRTAFSLFIMERRDRVLIGIMVALISVLLVGAMRGATIYYFYPTFSGVSWNTWQLFTYSIYFLLLTIPLWIELKEAWKWQSLKSKM